MLNNAAATCEASRQHMRSFASLNVPALDILVNSRRSVYVCRGQGRTSVMMKSEEMPGKLRQSCSFSPNSKSTRRSHFMKTCCISASEFLMGSRRVTTSAINSSSRGSCICNVICHLALCVRSNFVQAANEEIFAVVSRILYAQAHSGIM